MVGEERFVPRAALDAAASMAHVSCLKCESSSELYMRAKSKERKKTSGFWV